MQSIVDESAHMRPPLFERLVLQLEVGLHIAGYAHDTPVLVFGG
jgi:hypothetical protein